MSESKILQALDDLEGGRKWEKRTYLGCIVGVLAGAHGLSPIGMSGIIRDNEFFRADICALSRAARELYGEQLNLIPASKIEMEDTVVTLFNDNPETTWEDVETVMKEAAGRMQSLD